MQRSTSPQFPYDKFSSSKQVKFAVERSPARKASPLPSQSYKPSKIPQNLQSAPKLPKGTSPKKLVPPHNLGRKKEEELPRYNSAMRSSGPQANANMFQTAPNPLSQSFSPNRTAARLQDLCNEDKQKIGDLMKKLAEEKEEKERLRRELELKDHHYKDVINNLAKENDVVVKDSIELQNQFKYSLSLLKNFQDVALKQQKEKQKEEKKQKKLKKQQEEQAKYQQYLQQQEQLQQQQQRERQQVLEQRQYEQQVQKHEYVKHQQKQKEREKQQQQYEKQQQHQQFQQHQYEQKQQYPQPQSHQRQQQPQHQYQQQQQYSPNPVQASPGPSEVRRHLSSPVIKPTEGSPYLDKNGTRHLIQPEPGQAEYALSKERIGQTIRSPTKQEVDEALQREQGVMNEIARLKHDIESLTNSFKTINFSPADSYTVKENERSQNQIPTRDQKKQSPIKVAQSLKPSGSAEQPKSKNRKAQEEDELYQEQIYPQTLPVRPEAQREVPSKATIMKKGASASMSTANMPYRYEGSGTSSDEDELAVAQKWLNLRKEKIQKINQQLSENKVRQDTMEKDSLYSDQDQSEQAEEADYYYPQQEPQRRQGGYPQREEERGGKRVELYQEKNATKSSPSFRDVNTGRFASTRQKEVDVQTQHQNSMKKGLSGSGSKGLSDTGVINLNQLTVDDMVRLKNMLEEKIYTEKPSDLINSKAEFAIRSPEKAKSLLSQPQNSQTLSYQGNTYPELSKSGSSFKQSRQEYDYNPLERFGKSGSKALYSEGPEYKDSAKKGPGDSSIVRDFDSIAYTLTKPESYKMTESYKDNYDGYGLVTEVPRTLEDESSQMEEYEEKLKEFLKVRDRLIKQNKIRNQGVDIDSVLTHKMNEYGQPNSNYVSAQKSGHINSPPSVRSVGRLEAPKLSEREMLGTQDSLMQGVDYYSRGQMGNNPRFFKERTSYQVENLEEAKTPDYGYGASQRSHKTEPRDSEVGSGQVIDDFYDEGLFDLVDNIEHKESTKPTPSNSAAPEIKSTSRTKGTKEMKSVENEFNSLFNTVRSMFTNNEDNTTTERIREKLLNKFDKSDLVESKLSSEEEDQSESFINLPQQVLGKGNERRASDLSGNMTHGRPSKTDSSIVETDTSILAISKKIEELKKKKNQQK